MIKTKPCKGMGKALNYGCGLPTDQRIYGLGLTCGCYPKWLYNSKEGLEKIERAKIKASKQLKKESEVKAKEMKDSLTDWREKLQTKVQEIARLIDIGQPCLARGYHANQLHAGHIYSKGSEKSMSLNLHNMHRQSSQSNHFQNEDGLLREGLMKEYGTDYFEFITGLRQTPPLKYTNLEYKEFYKKACAISNDLKRQGRTFGKEERIAMRNLLNLELGIYEKNYCVYNQTVKK